MEYLLYLSGGDAGRTISLEQTERQMSNAHHEMGGEDMESSYYARERGTYEVERSGDCDECSEEFWIDVPKSIETESFPSSVGMV